MKLFQYIFFCFVLLISSTSANAQINPMKSVDFNDIDVKPILKNALLANGYFHGININSDLIDDFCYIDSGNSTLSCLVSGEGVYGKYFISKKIPEAGWHDSYMMADINNDGRADFCQLVYNWTRLQCYTSSGEGQNTTFTMAFTSGYLDGGWPHYRWLVDVDGDGRADFCRLITNQGNHYLTCRKMGSNGLDEKEYLSTRLSAWPADKVAYWYDSSGDGLPDFHLFFDKYDGTDMMVRFKNYTTSQLGFVGESSSIKTKADERVGSLVTNASGPNTASFCYLKGGHNLTCLDINEAVSGRTKKYFEFYINDPGWSDSRMWVDLDDDGYIDYCALTNWTEMRCWTQVSKQNKTFVSKTIDGGYNYWGTGTQRLNGMADSRYWAKIGSQYRAYTRIVNSAPNVQLRLLAISDPDNVACKAKPGGMAQNRINPPKPTYPPLPITPPNKEPPVSVVYRYDERPYSVIFAEGFTARGTNVDVLDHVDGGFRTDQAYLYSAEQLRAMNSRYIPTSSSADFTMQQTLNYFNNLYRVFRTNGITSVSNVYNVYRIQANSRMYSLRNSFIHAWAEGRAPSSRRGENFIDAWYRFIEPLKPEVVSQREWLAWEVIPREDIELVTTYTIPEDFYDRDQNARVTREYLEQNGIRRVTTNPNFRPRVNPSTSSDLVSVLPRDPSPGMQIRQARVGRENVGYYNNRRLQWPQGAREFLDRALSCFTVRRSSNSPNDSASACVIFTVDGGTDRTRIRPIGEYQEDHPCSEMQ